jgi:hypothetical protein
MNRPTFPPALSLLLLAPTLFLFGCGSNALIPDTITDPGVMPAVQGTVFGGHAPLVGAHVYVLQMNSGAIGGLTTSLLGTGSSTAPGGYPLQTNPLIGGDPNIPSGWKYVVTDSSGSFSLLNGYLCSGNEPVYLYAYGGAPTTPSVPEPNNPAVVNLATLGVCPRSDTFKGAVTYVYLNEVSTVATAYAFQGFTSPAHNDAIHIGYSGANSPGEGLAGIQNAAANTFQLYDIAGSVAGHSANTKTYGSPLGSSGSAVPNGGTGIVPQTVLDTLANILAACVDSGNSSYPATNAQCTTLFDNATSDGVLVTSTTSTVPPDTATAAINIARHPAGVGNSSFASNLFNIPTGVVPFLPALNYPPPDFTVAIQYAASTNSIYQGVRSVALDASGNFWISTWTTPAIAETTTHGTGYVAEATPLGVIMTTSGTSPIMYAPGNVAIDSSQNAWTGTANVSLGPIYEDGPSTGTTFRPYNPGFSAAIDPVADNSINSGLMYFTHGPTCTVAPMSCGGVADNNGTVTEVNAGGSAVGSGYIFLFPPGAFSTHAAIDSAGYEWITSDTATYGNAITRVDKNTAAVPLGTGFPILNSGLGICGSFISPEQPAIDSSGNAWIPVYGLGAMGSGVYVVSPTATHAADCAFYNTEYGASAAPYGAAVDGANNVWITNTLGGTSRTGYYGGGFGSLAELSATTGANLSSTNFQPINQISGSGTFTLNDPLNVAVDISGDVFVTNYAGGVLTSGSVLEFIGLATPLYGPLGVAAGASKIGTTP